MKLAIYSGAVSLLYALIAIAAPPAAEALIVAFVAALVVPACWKRVHVSRQRRRFL